MMVEGVGKGLKIKYLGTAAAERVPAIFCKCEVCEFARKNKGKEWRTQLQTVIDDGELLIDFPGDSFLHQWQHDIDFNEIEHLLLTHWHGDHLYAEDLALRMSGYGQNLDKILHVYGSEFTKTFYDRAFELEGRFDESRLVYHTIRPYEAIEISRYTIYPIPAQHGNFVEDCLVYAIVDQETGKSLFYTHDTGMPKDEDLNYLAEQQIVFDFVSLDCTGQGFEQSGPVHMSLKENVTLIEKMRAMGLVGEGTIYVASHFSHNGGLNHEAMQTLSEAEGVLTSYDGMEIDF